MVHIVLSINVRTFYVDKNSASRVQSYVEQFLYHLDGAQKKKIFFVANAFFMCHVNMRLCVEGNR